jgi:hypothetical protein
MTRPRQILLLIGSFATVAVILVACSSTKHVSDGRTPDEQQRIVEACLSMLHSSLTNEMDIQPDDPRVPQIIRSLHPIHIELAGSDAVVMCEGKPGEYHLSRRSHDAKPWVLYVAGPGYNGHEELLRLDHD